MYLVGLGLALLILKYLEIGPTAAWDWWVCLVPFGLAIAWWAWADASGWTKAKAIERELDRKKQRIDKHKVAIGTLLPKKKR